MSVLTVQFIGSVSGIGGRNVDVSGPAMSRSVNREDSRSAIPVGDVDFVKIFDYSTNLIYDGNCVVVHNLGSESIFLSLVCGLIGAADSRTIGLVLLAGETFYLPVNNILVDSTSAVPSSVGISTGTIRSIWAKSVSGTNNVRVHGFSR